ncbi:hypothetical protein [Nocardioides sp. GY 10127]|uniref:phage portal protein family protein n=1 Tax=Nocardioides sp. GY 10127 TaxID=2569762 RepID=UPI0010A89586|nr:hypothetical protein [Nocardioides sp. GY 10127]TIC78787.1 hypothetical protein E8D37_19010 [Nocardioides sp. GY 10127]
MAETPTARPVRERGYARAASSNVWWTDLTNETTPELRWPLSINVFDRMRKQDAQVASVLRAVTSPIIRTRWSIDGSGCAPEVTEFVARNLGLPIQDAPTDEPLDASLRGRDRFSWDDHLRLALLMLPFGHMYFEQVYRLDEATGLFMLRKLGERHPATIANVTVARDGGLVSITQSGTNALGGLALTYNGSSDGVTIPVSRLVAYVLDREGGNWLGQSLLRSAYKNWLLKDRALRTWSQSIDRQGMGLPIYTAAEEETNLDAGQEIAAGARSGDNSGAALPHGAQFDLVGVSGSLPDIDSFVRYQDEQIARAVLAHFLNLGTQTGSWALGSTFADFFTLSLQAIAEEVRDTANAHIIEDLVDINFGATVPAPRLVFDEIGSRASELDRVREAAGLSSDADLVKFLRSTPATQGGTA